MKNKKNCGIQKMFFEFSHSLPFAQTPRSSHCPANPPDLSTAVQPAHMNAESSMTLIHFIFMTFKKFLPLHHSISLRASLTNVSAQPMI